MPLPSILRSRASFRHQGLSTLAVGLDPTQDHQCAWWMEARPHG